MYILCIESPCTKKTPLVYEMDSVGICPVCGEAITVSESQVNVEKIVYTPGHVLSNETNCLLFKKSLIMTDRTLKGATT